MSDPSPQPGDLNLAFAEELYTAYLRDSSSVSEEWRRYFDSFNGSGRRESTSRLAQAHWTPGPTFHPAGLFRPAGNGTVVTVEASHSEQVAGLQDRVDKLVRAHRVRGHIIARIDPLGLPRPSPPKLVNCDRIGPS